MTNSRCFRIDLTVTRFVTCTKCNSTKIFVGGLSSLGAETSRLSDYTSPVRQMLRPLKSSGYQDRILDHTRAGRRCFQISSSRGLTPYTCTDTWVLPISM